jgi:tetratricopeptide (TPR) repeat protein
VLVRLLVFISLCAWHSIEAQETLSVIVNDDTVRIESEGIAFLGSGITEHEAKILAMTDAKRQALESAGTYLESHSTVLNQMLVKDEIVAFSGSLLQVRLLEEKKEIIDNHFALKVNIEALIDVGVLNMRISDVRQNKELLALLEAERERNKELESKLLALQESLGEDTVTSAKQLVNQITATDFFNQAYSEGDHHKKIEYYSKAIELDPEYTLAYVNRATIHVYLGNYQEALQDYSKAIDIQPDYAMALCNRGYLYARLDMMDKAMDDFIGAVSIDPDNPMVYYNLSCIYALRNDVPRSIKYLEEALNKGFTNFNWIRSDTDLEAVRETDSFRRLAEKYKF